MDYSSKGMIASSITSIFMIILIFMFPLFILILVTIYSSKLADKAYEMKYGALYSELTLRRHASLYYNFLFVIRRAIFAVLCVFARDYQVI
jgi:hypothetical protein